MLGFISKSVLRSNRDFISATAIFQYPSNALRFFSSDAADAIGEAELKVDEPESKVEESDNVSTFTVSYLVNRCRLTPEAALNASKFVHLKSSRRPNLVHSFLRDNGFSDANITSLVAKRPSLILANPKTNLKPKFEFFASLGAPPQAVVKLLLEYPEILHKGLENNLLPSVEFLRGFLHTDEKIFHLISKCPGVLKVSLPHVLGPNVQLLRDEGISNVLIAAFLYNSPHVMILSAARFAKIVDKVRKMWIGPKRSGFLDAIGLITSSSDKEWECKVSIYEKWGWSADDLSTAFSKQPKCMLLSDSKIEKIMKYLVNDMQLDPLFPVKNPNVFMLSLKNRIIPRCSIIRYLLKMGVLSKEDLEINTVLEYKEEAFMTGFIKKYKQVLPELLGLYTLCKSCAANGRSPPV